MKKFGIKLYAKMCFSALPYILLSSQNNFGADEQNGRKEIKQLHSRKMEICPLAHADICGKICNELTA